MKQENKPDIEELLNGLIDGELTERQRTEVQRLISHDAKVAQRLWELQKCKMLIGSLPCSEAPADMLESIKVSLERRTLLGQKAERFDESEGAKHLLVRKVLAAAAMIGLVGVLATVIYTIVAPESTIEKPIISKDWQQPAGKVETEIEIAKPGIQAVSEKVTAKADTAVRRFSARLELKTNDLAAVNAFINRVIDDNGILDCVSSRGEEGKSIYFLSCDRESLNLMLSDLQNIWARFDSATLFVETDQIDRQIVVDNVSTKQINEIINQDSSEKCIQVAKDFAVLNGMEEIFPGKNVLAAVEEKKGDFITIPKPVLTSSEKTTKRTASKAKDKLQVHLTIVVIGSK